MPSYSHFFIASHALLEKGHYTKLLNTGLLNKILQTNPASPHQTHRAKILAMIIRQAISSVTAANELLLFYLD